MCRWLSVCGYRLALGWVILLNGKFASASFVPQRGPFYTSQSPMEKGLFAENDSDGDDDDDGDMSNMC